MRYKYILFFVIILTACRQKRQVDSSFYYWKTIYKQNELENTYLKKLNTKKLYVRITDVKLDGWQGPVSEAPIGFAENLPDSIDIVPVVFIENVVFADERNIGLVQLPANILRFVKGKLKQAGKNDFKELQIDCDWTATTKAKYFDFLTQLKIQAKGLSISVTLRLHQIKNQAKMGLPPVDKVLLMCYNMGNLRKYGNQISIIDINELKKYANKNLSFYALPIDIALPLFSWAVVFRNQEYLGLSRGLKLSSLSNFNLFSKNQMGLYQANLDLPLHQIKKGDEIRFEQSDVKVLKECASYLSENLSTKPITLVFYHLDSAVLNNHPIYELENTSNLLH